MSGGQQSGPQSLWAPWRMDYIAGLSTQPMTPAGTVPESACFLCDAAKHAAGTPEATARLVLINDERGMLLLNKYPYTNGHLLVAFHDHLGDLSDLTPAQRAGLMELTALAETLLRNAMNPQGINVGINLGRCAGAGLPGHLHVHLVPRWNGDVNFMQTVGQVRVIPQALEQSHAWLMQTLAKMSGKACL